METRNKLLVVLIILGIISYFHFTSKDYKHEKIMPSIDIKTQMPNILQEQKNNLPISTIKEVYKPNFQMEARNETELERQYNRDASDRSRLETLDADFEFYNGYYGN